MGGLGLVQFLERQGCSIIMEYVNRRMDEYVVDDKDD